MVGCNTLYEALVFAPPQPQTSVTQLFQGEAGLTLLRQCNEACKSRRPSEANLDARRSARLRSLVIPLLMDVSHRSRLLHVCFDAPQAKPVEGDLAQSLQRLEALVQGAHDGIITIDESQMILLVNNAAANMFGYQKHELLGQSLQLLVPQKYRSQHQHYVTDFRVSAVESRAMQSRAAVRGLTKAGVEFPIEVSISKVNIGGHLEMTAVIRDISEKNKLMEELLAASREDPLTGLYNRRYFTQVLKEELARQRRFGRGFVLMMIDIDHFKKINDQFSHECGDQALQIFTRCLIDNLRETDCVSRWGGEEFLVLCPEIAPEHGPAVAEKIRAAVESLQFEYNGQRIQFTVSVGVGYFSGNGLVLDTLINQVDQLLYQAKTTGRNRVVSN